MARRLHFLAVCSALVRNAVVFARSFCKVANRFRGETQRASREGEAGRCTPPTRLIDVRISLAVAS
ncbi:MAG: hypothetical protein WCO25_06415, partial [Candidatus Uhrbacteria bacterium]